MFGGGGPLGGVQLAGYFPGYTPAVVSAPAYALEEDFDGDGLMNGANDNLTPYLISVECIRGGDPSQLITRSIAGSLKATLLNTGGRFSSLKATGPLFGSLLPFRKVRLRSVYGSRILWTGFASGPPKPITQQGALPRASLEAVGALAILGNPNTRINPPAMQNATTGQIIHAILDAAGWPSSARIIDTGEVTLANWFVEDKGVLQALQEIEEAEGGRILEGTNWDIIFESRYHRLTSSAVSQATFDDSVTPVLGYRAADQDDPIRHVFNDVEITVNPMTTPGATQVLWTLDSPFTVAPLSSVTFIAKISDSTIAFATSWVNPVVTTDYIISGGTVVVTSVQTARTLEITVTNNHASQTAAGSLLRARGIPVIKGNPYKIRVIDQASINTYGRRAFPFPSPWFPNEAFARSSADLAIARYKDPHAVVAQTHIPQASAALQAGSIPRELSERVTFTANSAQTDLGISQDFYIEQIHHKLERKKLHETSWILTPAETNPGYWILGTSTLGTDTKLAY